MAKIKIDEFGVKPSGFLASWRYIRIFVDDETGAITNEDVPGKPSINLDNINDYRTNNRIYGEGNVITSFCNFDTYTNFVVTATDQRPFALVQTNLNSPDCGYLTPLPEPAVPYNPFGNPTYASYKTFSFCDIEGVPVDVDIERKEYTGLSSVIELGDGTPVVISYKEVEQKYETIRPLECTLKFIATDNFMLQEFYSNDERTFRVTVRKSGLIKFRGYIIPDSCSEPFNFVPYPVTIKCTDGLGGLKTVTYPYPVSPTFDLRQSFKDILCYCLAPLNLNLDLAIICNLYEKSMPNGLDDDPLDLATINPLRLANDKGATFTSYEVIDEVCKAWGAFFVQIDGVWNFVRFNELSNDVIRKRTYSYKGLRLKSDQLVTKRVIGGIFK